MSEPLTLLDHLLRRLDSPITDDDRAIIQGALLVIRSQTETAGFVKFAEGYQHGYDRGEADTTKAEAVPTPLRVAMDQMLEDLADDLASGRATAQ